MDGAGDHSRHERAFAFMQSVTAGDLRLTSSRERKMQGSPRLRRHPLGMRRGKVGEMSEAVDCVALVLLRAASDGEFFWIEPSRHAERRSDDRLSAASISPASSLLVVQIKRLVPDTQCRKRAESARTGVASRKTGVRAKAALALGSKLNQIVG